MASQVTDDIYHDDDYEEPCSASFWPWKISRGTTNHWHQTHVDFLPQTLMFTESCKI